jgi:hypothetical protein
MIQTMTFAGVRGGQVLLGLFLLGAASVPAVADPRSDALAGAARCQSIPDDRTFLNCLYGAMQPLRTELGLPSAPQTQVGLVPPATLPMVPPPQQQAGRAPPPARKDGMAGGLFGGKTEVTPQRMAAFDIDRSGFFTITLADGAIWKQLDGDTARAHWHGPPGELVVSIRSGAFGAHILQVRGQAATYKVIRVQ